MTEVKHTATADGAQLAYQVLGSEADPALLLIAGAGWSMDWWDDDLCALLVQGGLRVIRYDHRDTGESTTYPPGRPGYTSSQLAADPLAVLDAAGCAQAHLMGLSLGGGLAQHIAHAQPERVQSLTLIASTPVAPGRALPEPTPSLMSHLSSPSTPDWTNESEVADFLVDEERPYAGTHAFEEERIRGIVHRVIRRSTNVASASNHLLAAQDVEDFDLRSLDVPTLVVHGTEDPLFPVEHGRALAELIPHARLLELDGVGHQLPPRETWPCVVDAIVRLTTA